MIVFKFTCFHPGDWFVVFTSQATVQIVQVSHCSRTRKNAINCQKETFNEQHFDQPIFDFSTVISILEKSVPLIPRDQITSFKMTCTCALRPRFKYPNSSKQVSIFFCAGREVAGSIICETKYKREMLRGITFYI